MNIAAVTDSNNGGLWILGSESAAEPDYSYPTQVWTYESYKGFTKAAKDIEVARMGFSISKFGNELLIVGGENNKNNTPDQKCVNDDAIHGAQGKKGFDRCPAELFGGRTSKKPPFSGALTAITFHSATPVRINTGEAIVFSGGFVAPRKVQMLTDQGVLRTADFHPPELENDSGRDLALAVRLGTRRVLIVGGARCEVNDPPGVACSPGTMILKGIQPYRKDALLYDANTNFVSKAGDLSMPHYLGAIASIGNYALVTGGISKLIDPSPQFGPVQSTAELYFCKP